MLTGEAQAPWGGCTLSLGVWLMCWNNHLISHSNFRLFSTLWAYLESELDRIIANIVKHYQGVKTTLAMQEKSIIDFIIPIVFVRSMFYHNDTHWAAFPIHAIICLSWFEFLYSSSYLISTLSPNYSSSNFVSYWKKWYGVFFPEFT